MTDQRARLLMAALGFAGCSMPSYDRAFHALRTWLDSWVAARQDGLPTDLVRELVRT